MPNTSLMVKFLSYFLEICCVELDYYKVVRLTALKLVPTVYDPGGFISEDFYLVSIATILVFTNFVKEFAFIWTEEGGEMKMFGLAIKPNIAVYI